MSKILDLKSWFNQDKAFIHIILNDEIMTQDSSDPVIKMKQDFLDKYWIFSVNETFYPIEQDTQIMYGDSKIELNEIHNFILKTKEKWNLKHKNTKNFPDIVFINRNLGSLIIIDEKLDKNHLIVLSPETFENFDDLKFTIGHELGHIDYNDHHKTKNFINFDKIQLLFLSLVTISIWGIRTDFSNYFQFLFGIGLGASYCLLFYIVLSYSTYQIRMKNYRMEFYCDAYSAYISGKVPVERISLGNFQNGYTHPASDYRKYFYSKFNEFNFYYWTSPTENYPNYFKYLSSREFFIEIKLMLSIFKKN